MKNKSRIYVPAPNGCALRRGNGLLQFWLMLALALPAHAALLLEEGFDYPAGGALASNTPWHGGNNSSLGVVGGNLSLLTLRETVPPGNQLQMGGGSGATAYRNFSAAPVVSVAGAAIYCSALFNCTLLPTNAQHLASLGVSGAGSFNGNDDPLALYVINAGSGYTFRIGHHGENATAGNELAAGTTHLIVFKYLFGGSDRCAVYVDPTPGSPEPAPDAITRSGEGDAFSNLEVIGFMSPALAVQAMWNLDTLRVGTNWADVIPTPNVLTISGPESQTACVGTPVTFNAAVIGTPPFVYQWRANGTAILSATQSSYLLSHASPADALKTYDVVVQDAFNSKTSSVATLMISAVSPQITGQPADQLGSVGANATFTVAAAGDQPLSYQWRSNGEPIPGATNSAYALVALSTADALNAYDVVVANPCGIVTSAPPAVVVFPHQFFGCDALPGFFGGMNLITTNAEATALFVWSCADPSLAVPNWTLEGQLGEQPLNDGTGTSRYSINVNPFVSPVYYLIGTTTSGPYVPEVPLSWITTELDGSYGFFVTNLLISAAGVLDFPAAPGIIQPPVNLTAVAGRDAQFTVSASGTEALRFQWFFNGSPLSASTNSALTLSAVTSNLTGGYAVVVTNDYGSVTSSVATLTVVPPPRVLLQSLAGGFKVSGTGIPGDIYLVQATTNLSPPANWLTLAGGLVASNGLIQFMDTNIAANPKRFYRLAFPTSVPTPPVIAQQPQARTVLAGKAATLSVGTTGSQPLNFQWVFQPNTTVPNATNSALTLPGATSANAGDYFVIITNFFGSVTSSIVNLTVLPPPQLQARMVAGAIQLSSLGVPGDPYLVQGATNLVPPVVWTTLATNVASPTGVIQFNDANLLGKPGFFYRLVAP